jgi:4-hydroxybenzoyl-CoA thioesterase/acyl-CoA thioester hydrolase
LQRAVIAQRRTHQRRMTAPFTTTRRVEFRDTDAAGIMHFSVFFTAMESAEHEFLRSLGFGILFEDAGVQLSFPRVSARCDYQSPIRFGDEYQIEVRIARIGTKSVTYEFLFSHAGRAVARGEVTAVCCRFEADGKPVSVPIPDWAVRRLRGETAA